MLIEMLADAGRHHVRPELLDALQTLLLRRRFADRFPTGGKASPVHPDRILALIISHYEVQFVVHSWFPGKAR
ncbi:hypothetical protein Y023_4207 [Burkholderia pseudomallei A79D]|nr:hypothetical protein J103_24645 [Burkholderia pseudomallei MSHR5855]KGD24326.1 hypothetical protein DO70_4908 [Burkholderia pseudomallei]KGX55297.1 hypothetical protein Y025_4138 [Burkholderia pseudomallei TSV32]KGX98553.1 hypothetical protein Y023_4207 [Burkholderia pseudomallei A79D]KYZ82568.1 hypothetical protein PTBPS01_12225 [Burkholderia pseudomallei]